MIQDCRSFKEMDLRELLLRAEADTLPMCPGGTKLELRRQRAYRLERADEISTTALKESRAMTLDECATFDRLLGEARLIEPSIAEADRRYQREVSYTAP